MMRIERRATRPRRAAMRPASAPSSIAREAGLRLPRHLATRIMLGDEFHIPALGATVLRLVLNPEVRQFQPRQAFAHGIPPAEVRPRTDTLHETHLHSRSANIAR